MSAGDHDSETIGTFLFGNPSDFFDPITHIETFESPLREPLLAFKSNLASAFQVGSVPFQLTHAAVVAQRLNQLVMAEKIRCRTKVERGEIAEHETERVAHQIADARLSEEMTNEEIITYFADSTLQRLSNYIRDAAFREAVHELLRQALIICWEAFEIFANDTIRALLNARPHLINGFLKDKNYKALLSGEILLEALETNRFDISSAMGDIFCEVAKLDSLKKIRTALNICAGEPSLDAMLKDGRLWRLSQQRHLIVHRRGVIDARYLERTSDRGRIGERLKLGSKYVEASLVLVRDVGCNLSVACQRRLVESGYA